MKNKVKQEDSAFVRCVNSKTLKYFDVPIAFGNDFYFGNDVCKIAHNLNTKNNIFGQVFEIYDFWYIYHIVNGKQSYHGDDMAAGAVLGCDYKGFWFDPKTFKINGLISDRLYYDSPLPDSDEVEKFIKDFNSKLGSA